MAVIHSITGGEHLAGTADADTFVYDAVADSTTTDWDHLAFNRAQGDKIDLSKIPLTGANPPAALHWAGVDPTDPAAKVYGVWQWGDDIRAIRIDTDGDGAANMSIEIDGHPTMEESDFIFSVPPPPPEEKPRTLIRILFDGGTQEKLLERKDILCVAPVWSFDYVDGQPRGFFGKGCTVGGVGFVRNATMASMVAALRGAGVNLVEFALWPQNPALGWLPIFINLDRMATEVAGYVKNYNFQGFSDHTLLPYFTPKSIDPLAIGPPLAIAVSGADVLAMFGLHIVPDIVIDLPASTYNGG